MVTMEEKFRLAWVDACRKTEDLGIPMKRTLTAIDELGAVKAGKRAIARGRNSDGFAALAKIKRLELSLEALILHPAYGALFTDEEANFCLDSLMQAGFYEI